MTDAAWIRARIAEVLARDGHLPGWPRAVCRHGFLPLYLGWVEVLGIRPDGELVRWDEDAPDRVGPVRDRTERWLALAQGAARWPALRHRLPPRPAGAWDCEDCGGTGVFSARHPHIVCRCLGLGWRVAD